MKKFSGEKGGGTYFEFHIQQGRLIEGGRCLTELDAIDQWGMAEMEGEGRRERDPHVLDICSHRHFSPSVTVF